MLPPPCYLGLPSRYDYWREGQETCVERVVDAPRFSLHAAPTGFGKSLAYMAASLLEHGRVAILTSTKGLQQQLNLDFLDIGLRDVRGMNSYRCVAAEEWKMSTFARCSDGPCLAGVPCHLKDEGCLYYDALRRALAANLVVTNYHYWMYAHRYGNGLGSFSALILDEAHDAADILSDFAGAAVDVRELGALLDDARHPLVSAQMSTGNWREWASDCLTRLNYRLALQQATVQEAVRRGVHPHGSAFARVSRMKALTRPLETIRTIQGKWIIQRQDHWLKFDPVWPAPFAEGYLFKGIPKVVMFSATLRPKAAQHLGIEEYKFYDYHSPFPVGSRPVYHIPTVSVKQGSTDDDFQAWLRRIDQIIGSRLDRKGIIHCVSYERAEFIRKNSEYRHIMLHHNKANTSEMVDSFRRAQSPKVLISPSVMTGYDFPYIECEYQIVAKVPFPDRTDQTNVLRDTVDPEYSLHRTAQSLVQATGRGMRAEDDQCETFIVDDNVRWLVGKYPHLFPRFWLEAFQSRLTIPQPLPKLGSRHQALGA